MNNSILEFINEIIPNHQRTSCTDEFSGGNEYFNEFGLPRCARCALLYRLKTGNFPYGVTVKELNIKFSGNPRITE